MDVDSYLTTNVLETSTETFGKGYHYVDVGVVALVIVGVISVGVIVPGTFVDMYVTVLKVALGFKSVEGPCRVFASD